MPSSTEGGSRQVVVRTMLRVGPVASIAGAAALAVVACAATSPVAVFAPIALAPMVVAGGMWRSTSSLTVAGCALALVGIGVLSKEIVSTSARVPLGALLFASAFIMAAVAVFQAFREPAVATWVDAEVSSDGFARRPQG